MAYMRKRAGGPQEGPMMKRRYQKRSWRSKRLYDPFALNKQVHTFRRGLLTYTVNGSGLSGTSPLFGSFVQALSDLPNSSEFTSLYDQYRIDYVVHRFMLVTPVEAAQSASGSSYPVFHWVVDNDDAATPGSANELRQHSNYKVAQLVSGRTITIGYKPSIAATVYNTAVTSGYSSKQNQWIDCTNAGVPHYGLKWSFDQWGDARFRLVVESTYTISFRNPR